MFEIYSNIFVLVLFMLVCIYSLFVYKTKGYLSRAYISWRDVGSFSTTGDSLEDNHDLVLLLVSFLTTRIITGWSCFSVLYFSYSESAEGNLHLVSVVYLLLFICSLNYRFMPIFCSLLIPFYTILNYGFILGFSKGHHVLSILGLIVIHCGGLAIRRHVKLEMAGSGEVSLLSTLKLMPWCLYTYFKLRINWSNISVLTESQLLIYKKYTMVSNSFYYLVVSYFIYVAHLLYLKVLSKTYFEPISTTILVFHTVYFLYMYHTWYKPLLILEQVRNE